MELDLQVRESPSASDLNDLPPKMLRNFHKFRIFSYWSFKEFKYDAPDPKNLYVFGNQIHYRNSPIRNAKVDVWNCSPPWIRIRRKTPEFRWDITVPYKGLISSGAWRIASVNWYLCARQYRKIGDECGLLLSWKYGILREDARKYFWARRIEHWYLGEAPLKLLSEWLHLVPEYGSPFTKSKDQHFQNENLVRRTIIKVI